MTTAICYQLLVCDVLLSLFTKLLTPYFLPIQYVGKGLSCRMLQKNSFLTREFENLRPSLTKQTN